MHAFPTLLRYLIVLLFTIAVLNAVVLVKLSDTPVHSQRPELIGGVVGVVTMTVQSCGDGIVHGTEQCDGAALNGSSCASLGYGGGTLSCKANCSFNTSACSGSDTTAPVVSLQYPMNNTNYTWKDISFWYNVTDAASGIERCKLFLNGEKKKESNKVNETIYQSLTATGLSNGNYTWQVNCTDNSTNRNNGSSAVRLIRIQVNSSDQDGDGIADSIDPFLGTNSSVNTSTIQNPILTINGSTNLSGNFSGNMTVNLTSEGITVMSFSINFATAALDFSNFRMEIEEPTATIGQFEIGNIVLPAGVTKTVYLNKVDPAVTTICIKDSSGAAVSDISADCSGASEIFLTCDGTTTGAYRCSEGDGRFQISGLSHSAGQQQATGPGGTTSGISSSGVAQRRIGQQAAAPAAPSAAPAPSAAETESVHREVTDRKVVSEARPSATPVPASPIKSKLFDVEVEPIEKFKEIIPGEDIYAEINLFYLGDERLGKRVDVKVYYAILDSNEQIVTEKLETVGIETRTTFIGKLSVPLGTAPGQYWFYSRIKVGNEIAESFAPFSVLSEKPAMENPKLFVPQQYVLILIFVLSIFLLIIVHHQYRLEKHLAEHHEKVSEEDLLRMQQILKQR